MKDRISQLLKLSGKTQKDFADELCLSPATLTAIFKGNIKPSTNVVKSIHEVFPHVNINWLLFGEGEMYTDEVTPPTEQTQQPLQHSSVEPPLFPETNPASVNHSFMAIAQTELTTEMVKNQDKIKKNICEIRVFFDDGTYQTFIPS